MKTFIIIVHFGKLSITQECIESLYKVEKNVFSIVVVNNAKEEIFRKDFNNKKDLIVINNMRNVGFAAGVNIGIQYALTQGAGVILLLNNDTNLKTPVLSKLSTTLQKNKTIGIVAPAIYFSKNGTFLYDVGGRLNHLTGRTSHTEIADITHQSQHQVEYVSGCCMAIKSEVFQKIGFFDERFFLYYEDVDFCLRVEKAGYSVAVDPSAVIYHELSKSAGQLSDVSMYHQIRSARVFGKKYFASGIKAMMQTLFVTYQAMVFVIKSHHVSGIKGLFS